MAGQARRGTRGQGRPSHGASSWPVIAAVSAGASGSATAITTEVSKAEPTSAPEPIRALPTRATYRNLLLRGLAPDEAANLTAYLAGIQVGESHWTIRQVNQLLFLREMNRTGHFTEANGSQLH
jgi:hypothetical protein